MENEISIRGLVSEISVPSASYHFLIVGGVRYGTYKTPPACRVGDSVVFTAFQKGNFWNVSGAISIDANAPPVPHPTSELGITKSNATILATLGVRVGAAMNQSVNCFAHGAIRRPDITKFAYDLALSACKIEQVITHAIAGGDFLSPPPPPPRPLVPTAVQPPPPPPAPMSDDFDKDLPF